MGVVEEDQGQFMMQKWFGGNSYGRVVCCVCNQLYWHLL